MALFRFLPPINKRKHAGKQRTAPHREREAYPKKEGRTGTAPQHKNKQTNSTGEDNKRQRTSKRQKHPQPLHAYHRQIVRPPHRHKANRTKQGNRATNQPKKPRGQQGEDENTNTRTHQRKGKQRGKPGGSTGQGEKGHARTRGGTQVPQQTPKGGPGSSQMNTSVRRSRVFQQCTHSGVEGHDPHKATAFDATGCTKSRNKALQHAKQDARQPSRTHGNDTWREAPVTTWARQPRGVVQGGGNSTHKHKPTHKQQTRQANNSGSVGATMVRSRFPRPSPKRIQSHLSQTK